MALSKTEAANIATCYGQSRWGREYGWRPAKGQKNPYTKGYHRALDLRAQNASRTASIVNDVFALVGGVVAYIGRPNSSLGPCVVIRTSRRRGTGTYEGHGHVIAVSGLKVGQTVKAGQKIGRTASASQRPGLIGVTWTAPHDHMGFFDELNGLWMTSYADYDPAPIIRAQLSAAAAALKPPVVVKPNVPKPPAPKPTPPKPTPVPVPAPVEGDEDMMKPTVHFRTDGGGYDMTVAHPEIGAHLKPFTGKNAEVEGVRETSPGPTRGRVVNVYRGFMATNDEVVGGAWARLYAGGPGKETTRTTRALYEAIQVEAARLATAIAT